MKRKLIIWIVVIVIVISVIITTVILYKKFAKDEYGNKIITLQQKLNRNISIIKG